MASSSAFLSLSLFLIESIFSYMTKLSFQLLYNSQQLLFPIPLKLFPQFMFANQVHNQIKYFLHPSIQKYLPPSRETSTHYNLTLDIQTMDNRNKMLLIGWICLMIHIQCTYRISQIIFNTTAHLQSISTTQSGNTLVVGTFDMGTNIYEYNNSEYQLLQSFGEQDQVSWDNHISPDGKWVVINTYGRVNIYVRGTKIYQLHQSIEVSQMCYEIAMSEDGHWLMVGCHDYSAYVYHYDGDQFLPHQTIVLNHHIGSVAWSDQQQLLVLGESGYSVRVYGFDGGQLLEKQTIPYTDLAFRRVTLTTINHTLYLGVGEGTLARASLYTYQNHTFVKVFEQQYEGYTNWVLVDARYLTIGANHQLHIYSRHNFQHLQSINSTKQHVDVYHVRNNTLFVGKFNGAGFLALYHYVEPIPFNQYYAYGIILVILAVVGVGLVVGQKQKIKQH